MGGLGSENGCPPGRGLFRRSRSVAVDRSRVVHCEGDSNVPCSERRTELRRRRHRRKKIATFARKLPSATVSERQAMADKLRNLTPGAQIVIERWELEKR
jgi:hypothetical protein